jgi:hypothetical protein
MYVYIDFKGYPTVTDTLYIDEATLSKYTWN